MGAVHVPLSVGRIERFAYFFVFFSSSSRRMTSGTLM
jgi:hypothetical protein